MSRVIKSPISRFVPAILFVVLLLMAFWGRGILNAYQNPRAFDRLPSSYDKNATIPIQQQVNDATTPYLLMEFYQDKCLNCQALAPLIHEWNSRENVASCVTLIPVNADKADNRFFTDIFQVDELPSLYIFQPDKMKKTRITLPESPVQVPGQVKQSLEAIARENKQDLPEACANLPFSI